MITRAWKSKEERKDAKQTKKEKKGLNVAALETQCRNIGRKTKTGSSFNAQHWEKGKKAKIGRMVDAAALSTQCRSMRGLVEKLKIQCRSIE